MPPSVAAATRKNIKTLLATAQKENIVLPELRQNYMEVPSVKPGIKDNQNKTITKMFDNISKQYPKSGSQSSAKLHPKEQTTNVDCSSADKANEHGDSNENISTSMNQVEKSNSTIVKQFGESLASTSTAGVVVNPDLKEQSGTSQSQEDVLNLNNFKYGYKDIITGSFEEKLDEHLAKGVDITQKNRRITELNAGLVKEYNEMINRSQYQNMLQFRKILPTYGKRQEILDAIAKNQVLVISGETGCGKSTQVPQLILDDAMCNNRGAHVKILVTQPRRIAASSLATRVAKERAEKLGNSVGYAVRLECVVERHRGSIQYCTTGILLSSLEINQSLTNISHIILDEVHERDSNIDLAMCMLKQVLKKRSDLKLILMSATIDSESLCEYFDNCMKMHIEGLAYPVKDVYLEEVLALTKFTLPPIDTNSRNINKNVGRKKKRRLERAHAHSDKKNQKYLDEVGDWINSKSQELDESVIDTLKNPKVEELNFELVIRLIRHIVRGDPGAILIFVPGSNDISKVYKLLENNNIRPPAYEVFSLHSKLPSLEQNKIFEKPPNNIRKIIIATNIAETSITVDDVVYVIDCGRHKIKGLNIVQNVQTLNVEYISKANLRQRRGRAGRCQPGICYHLLTSFRADRLQERTLPELQRSDLLEAVLTIKRLRLGLAKDALKKVPSPPAEASIDWAVKQLQRCGALNAEEKLTPLGWHMARLPLHPSAGKLVLLGALFGCLDRAASIAAVWGFKDPFVIILGKERDIDMRKRHLAMGEPSDHVVISEAIIGFENCPYSARQDYCYANFLSYNTCRLLSDMKKQLGGNLKAMGFLASGDVKSSWENRNANNLSLFKALIAASLFPNIATTRWLGVNSKKPRPTIRIMATTPEDGSVSIHPSSVMCHDQGSKGCPRRDLRPTKTGANWLVYWMKQRSVQLYIFEVTLIYSLPLLFFGDFIVTEDPLAQDGYILEVSSVNVRVTRETANLLYDLRVLLDYFLASKIMSDNSHSGRDGNFQEQVMNTIMELITAEDEGAEYMGDDIVDSDFDYSESDNYSYHAYYPNC